MDTDTRYYTVVSTKAEKMKKILYFVTKSNFGGAQKYVYDLATTLKNQHDVVVLAGGNGTLFKKLHQENVRTISLPDVQRNINIVQEIKSFFEVIKILQTENPDVLHLNSPKAGGLGALTGRIAGVKKIVYTAHGWAFYEDRPAYQRSLIQFFSYITVLLSDTTIAVSKRDQHAFDGWLCAKNKIIHIPNGVTSDTSLSKTDARTTLHSYDIPTDGFMVGTIAELTKNKGLAYLVDAAQKIPNATFVVIGEGEDREKLESLISKYGLQDRFFLLGFIENAPRLLSAFDVFVLPSIKEGLPYVLLEAGLAGVPVVATQVGGVPEVINHKELGMLVSRKNSEGIVDAIVFLQQNQEKKVMMGNNLKEKVTREYSQKNTIDQTVSVYNR